MTPRPQVRDIAVRLLAAQMALPAMLKWFGHDCPPDNEIVEALVETFDKAWHDGYEICRHLEQRHGWQPDAELVAIFDTSYVSNARFALVRNWVTENTITPQFKIGEEVAFNWYGGTWTAGPIDDVYLDAAIYSVQITQEGRISYVPVPFENAVRSAPREAAETAEST